MHSRMYVCKPIVLYLKIYEAPLTGSLLAIRRHSQQPRGNKEVFQQRRDEDVTPNKLQIVDGCIPRGRAIDGKAWC